MIQALYNDSRNDEQINPQMYAGRCSWNNMLTITFGFRTNNIHHPIVSQALRLSREFMNLTGPMSNLIDFVPVLQTLPFSMRTRGRDLHNDLVMTYGGFIRSVERKTRKGILVPNCLAKTMIQLQEEECLDELDMSILASAFMIGGVETVCTLETHPDEVKIEY